MIWFARYRQLLIGLVIGALVSAALAWAGTPVGTIWEDVWDQSRRGLRRAPGVPFEHVLHTNATATGASLAQPIAGYSKFVIQLTLAAGTATVSVETSADNVKFRTINCDLTQDAQQCFADIAAKAARTNITACSGCNVTTKLLAVP